MIETAIDTVLFLQTSRQEQRPFQRMDIVPVLESLLLALFLSDRLMHRIKTLEEEPPCVTDSASHIHFSFRFCTEKSSGYGNSLIFVLALLSSAGSSASNCVLSGGSAAQSNGFIPVSLYMSLVRAEESCNSERPFKCPLCDYSAKTKYRIKEHIIDHSKSFVCDVCQRG